jgi:uncharacterized protein (DUF2249 family)
LDRGENPLPRLLEAAERLGAGDELEVTAPFLPAPLIEKLRGDGFVFQVRQAGAGAWVVVFRRPDSPEK